MNGPTRIAIVGAGLVGRRHADAIWRNPGADLSAIVDPSNEGRHFAAEHGVPCHSNLAELFAADHPDGVILSTPTPLHVEQGLDCIQNRCAVLVEKPISNTAEDAMRLVRAAERANVPLLVGHHRRHNPLIQKARQIIDSGAVGAIRAVHSQCWFYKPDHYFDIAPWRAQKGAGPISVNLVHDIDLLRHLCGEIVSVQAQVAPSSRGFDNEEVAGAVMRFDNGAIGTLTLSDGIVAPWSWELTAREYPVYPATSQSCYLIGGSEASLSLPDCTLWNQNGKRDWWEPINATTIARPSSDPLDNQIAHFLSVIAEEAVPLVSGREGTRTLSVIEAIQKSARTGQAETPMTFEDAPSVGVAI